MRREDRLPGLIDGFQSADGTYGVYGARYSVPGSLREIEDLSAQIEELTLTAFPALVPGAADLRRGVRAPRKATSWASIERPGAGTTTAAATCAWAPDLTDDGAVVVGMVYGPYDWFDGTEPYRILSSMIESAE